MNRSEFLCWFATTVAAGSVAREARAAQAGTLPTRRVGRTGRELPILALGGAHLANTGSERAARAVVDTALDEGIRLFDNAESYDNGNCERWVGAAVGSRRGEVWLMSKTFDYPARRPEIAERHLAGSLQRLGTDYLDLWQLHSVRSVQDVDLAFAPGGTMERILAQRATGVVTFVGVTGHLDPAANLRAIWYWDRGLTFDVMQMPINPMDYHQKSFQRTVLPELVKRDIGVLAMKTSADNALPRHRLCSFAECHRYAWSLPVSLAVVGMTSPAQVRENAARARAFRPYTDAERRALLDRLAPKAAMDLEWYKGPAGGLQTAR